MKNLFGWFSNLFCYLLLVWNRYISTKPTPIEAPCTLEWWKPPQKWYRSWCLPNWPTSQAYLPPDLFTIHRGTTNVMHHQAGRYVVLLLIPLTGSNIDFSGSYLYIPAQPLFRWFSSWVCKPTSGLQKAHKHKTYSHWTTNAICHGNEIECLSNLANILDTCYLPPYLFTFHWRDTNVMHHLAGRNVTLLLISLISWEKTCVNFI